MRKLGVLLLLFFVFLACFPLWLPLPGKFLNVEDDLRRADAIVLLRGDAFYRFPKAIDLYQRGFAKEIVLSPIPEREQEFREYYQFHYRIAGIGYISPAEYARRVFEYFGQNPDEGIVMTESETTSTYDEAVASREWMLERGYKTLILIGGTYYTRRALMIFKMAYQGTGIEIYPVSAVNPIYDPPHWWRAEKDVKKVLEEYVSIAFNFFYHFVMRHHRTSFDTF